MIADFDEGLLLKPQEHPSVTDLCRIVHTHGPRRQGHIPGDNILTYTYMQIKN